MPNEMIERVARALCRKRVEFNISYDNNIIKRSADFIDRAVDAGWEHFEEQAKTAIEAMREPTEGMIIKGLISLIDKIEEMDPNCETAELIRNKEEIKAVYKSMIDEALK